MRQALRLALTLILLAGSRSAFAAPAAAPATTEGDCTLHDFHFAGGEALPELRLHYTTLGTPVRDAAGVVRNAVLILHGTTGDGKSFLREQFAGQLFGSGELLDAARKIPGGAAGRVGGALRGLTAASGDQQDFPLETIRW